MIFDCILYDKGELTLIKVSSETFKVFSSNAGLASTDLVKRFLICSLLIFFSFS